MTAAAFDFQALAARAHADNPDAALFDALEGYGEQERIYKRERRGAALWRAVAGAKAAEDRLTAIRPATLDGMLAKMRYATKRMRGAPILKLQHATMLDAIAWMERKGRAGACGSDAALFEAVEGDKSASRRFAQVLARLRRSRSDERGHTLAERGSALHRSATEAGLASDRLAATRPATLDGLSAKLRHAVRRMHRCPAFEAQHAAFMDAIAWFEPPKRGRTASKNRAEARL